MLSFSFPLFDRSPRDEREGGGKRDIGSRHGEVFVSILSFQSLSRNPNFHHSPTYRQIKAGWGGGGISSIETACNQSVCGEGGGGSTKLWSERRL